MTTVKEDTPQKYLNFLQQCLSSDKKPIGIVIGAGCPMAVSSGTEGNPPLISDIAGITIAVRTKISACAVCGPILQKVEANFTKDGRRETTVEDVLTHIRSLRAIAGNDEVRGLTANDLEKLDEKVCETIYSLVDKKLPDIHTPYHKMASWVEGVQRDSPIEVFTTNYDLLMEQAFEDTHVPYFDGFAGVRRPFFDLRAMEEDKLPPRWARLWKLHGSVNWYQTDDNRVLRGTTTGNERLKRVIHPSHLKYEESRRLPYLAMIDRVRAFLKQPTATLIICGYSFRDEHINEVILQGLESTQTAIAFALLFGSIDSYPQAVALAYKHSNLTLLARDGAVVSKHKAKWREIDTDSFVGQASRWISLTPIDGTTESSKRHTELLLGDFAVFGSFLQELVGEGYKPLMEANV